MDIFAEHVKSFRAERESKEGGIIVANHFSLEHEERKFLFVCAWRKDNSGNFAFFRQKESLRVKRNGTFTLGSINISINAPEFVLIVEENAVWSIMLDFIVSIAEVKDVYRRRSTVFKIELS